MLNTESKNILRWIALPFVAFIGAFLGSVLLGLFQWFSIKMFGPVSADGWYARYVLPFLSSVFFGYFYSTISLEVAPKSKIITATVMVTLLGVFSLFGLFLAWKMQSNYGFGYFLEALFGGVGGMIAAIVTVANYKEKDN